MIEITHSVNLYCATLYGMFNLRKHLTEVRIYRSEKEKPRIISLVIFYIPISTKKFRNKKILNTSFMKIILLTIHCTERQKMIWYDKNAFVFFKYTFFLSQEQCKNIDAHLGERSRGSGPLPFFNTVQIVSLNS